MPSPVKITHASFLLARISDHKRKGDAMRRPGSRMIQTNFHGRPDFWITPSGCRVEPDTAKRIINHPQVIGGKDALFPGHHQTWRMRPGDDAV
jgi:hypothetical protein